MTPFNTDPIKRKTIIRELKRVTGQDRDFNVQKLKSYYNRIAQNTDVLNGLGNSNEAATLSLKHSLIEHLIALDEDGAISIAEIDAALQLDGDGKSYSVQDEKLLSMQVQRKKNKRQAQQAMQKIDRLLDPTRHWDTILTELEELPTPKDTVNGIFYQLAKAKNANDMNQQLGRFEQLATLIKPSDPTGSEKIEAFVQIARQKIAQGTKVNQATRQSYNAKELELKQYFGLAD